MGLLSGMDGNDSPDEHLLTVNERELVVDKALGNPGFLM